MSRRIAQIRYYGSGDSRNWPQSLTEAELKSGKAFSLYYPIIQLGIQSTPGLIYANKQGEEEMLRPIFYINGGSSIEIGKTGIYELNLEDIGYINKLAFDQTFIEGLKRRNDEYPNSIAEAGLMVDMVYEGG